MAEQKARDIESTKRHKSENRDSFSRQHQKTLKIIPCFSFVYENVVYIIKIFTLGKVLPESSAFLLSSSNYILLQLVFLHDQLEATFGIRPASF